MKGTRILVILAVVATLAVGGLGTAWASSAGLPSPAGEVTALPEVQDRPINALGVIASIAPEDPAAAEHVIALKTRRGPVEVTANADTEYRVPGVAEPSLADLAVGDAVNVKAVADSDILVAKAIMKVPGKGLVKQLRQHTVVGEVTAIDGANITLQAPRGSITVITDEDTKYRVPGVEEPGLADVTVGDRVAAAGRHTDEELVARLIAVLPPPGPVTHLTGEVSQVEGATITVTDKDGNTFTIDVPQGVEDVEVGQRVNVTIGDKHPGRLAQIGQLKQQAGRLLERLQKQHGPRADRIQGDALN